MPPPAYNLSHQSLLAGLLDPVITIDAYGKIRFASDSVTRVFGYEPRELIDQNIRILMPEPHYSAHDGYLENYRQTGDTWILNEVRELEAVHKDGTTFWIELSVARIDSAETEPLFAGSFRDISERKKFERALRESEARFRAIVDGELELISLLDRDGRVLEVNRAAQLVAGMTREDLLGAHFWEPNWWGEHREECRDWVALAASGATVREQIDLQTRSGLVSFDFSLKPILGEDGKPEMLLAEGRDITELKRVLQREREIFEALAQLGEQASVLAHEIKNPITSIHLALRALAGQLGEDHATVLSELSERLERLEQKLRRTLSFTRPIEPDRAPANVLPLLLAPVDALRPEAEHREVELTLDVSPDCGVIHVDAGYIESLISNLVRNALDAVANGGNIQVSAERSETSLTVIVDDDGPGLPDLSDAELFKPFVTTKEAGTGIGLAYARKIAEVHGGTLTAGDSPLGGARFRLKLPVPST